MSLTAHEPKWYIQNNLWTTDALYYCMMYDIWLLDETREKDADLRVHVWSATVLKSFACAKGTVESATVDVSSLTKHYVSNNVDNYNNDSFSMAEQL